MNNNESDCNRKCDFVYQGKEYPCGTSLTMDLIGGKWKAVILWHLQDDKKRFAELKRLIPSITERILSIQLKQLEASGIIKRKVYTRKPPLKVEYSLTEFGTTLIPVLKVIATWGNALMERPEMENQL